MIRFLLRRMLHAAILVFITLTATFFIVRLAPGDPLARYYRPDIDPRVMTTVRHQFGLDRPLPVQYAKTLMSFARGDFGVSFSSHRPVSDIIRDTLPRTLQLTGLALLIQVWIGIGLGLLSAVRRNSAFDRAASLVFLIIYSVPSFVLGFLFIALFALKLDWFPAAGVTSLHAPPVGGVGALGDRAAHMVLPVTVLALGSAAALARYTRWSVLDIVSLEFIRTARAKGLPEKAVMWRHVLKNAAPQIFTVLGLSVPFLLGGAVVIEKVFAWPGIGALLVDSIFARDYPVVLAVNFVGACLVILGNFFADLSYLWADPRVGLAQRQGPSPL